MPAIKVLVVDDSALVRKMLTDLLTAEAGLEVAATAGTASQAMAKLEQVKPDIITLDVEMPGTNGLDLLQEIRRLCPRLPIVMFSSLTQRGGATTLEALARGATDYATKPSGAASREEALEHVRRELVPKLVALGKWAEKTQQHAAPPVPAVVKSGREEWRAAEILAVGCSTGGPNALIELFSALPPAIPVPILIVQHMPPIFTKLLAERLTALGRVPVREAVDGDLVEQGKGLIAPGGYHMRVVRRSGVARVTLDQTAPVNSCRPAVDNLFESVADEFDAKTLALVMTGMGQDGLRGCERIRERGGQVVVQDEASSIVWGMPGFVARAGLAHAVLPLPSLASEVLARVGRGRTAGSGVTRSVEHSNVR